jgi:hypothetical protein
VQPRFNNYHDYLEVHSYHNCFYHFNNIVGFHHDVCTSDHDTIPYHSNHDFFHGLHNFYNIVVIHCDLYTDHHDADSCHNYNNPDFFYVLSHDVYNIFASYYKLCTRQYYARS